MTQNLDQVDDARKQSQTKTFLNVSAIILYQGVVQSYISRVNRDDQFFFFKTHMVKTHSIL